MPKAGFDRRNPGWLPIGTWRAVFAQQIIATFLISAVVVIVFSLRAEKYDLAVSVLTALSGFAVAAKDRYFGSRNGNGHPQPPLSDRNDTP